MEGGGGSTGCCNVGYPPYVPGAVPVLPLHMVVVYKSKIDSAIYCSMTNIFSYQVMSSDVMRCNEMK